MWQTSLLCIVVELVGRGSANNGATPSRILRSWIWNCDWATTEEFNRKKIYKILLFWFCYKRYLIKPTLCQIRCSGRLKKYLIDQTMTSSINVWIFLIFLLPQRYFVDKCGKWERKAYSMLHYITICPNAKVLPNFDCVYGSHHWLWTLTQCNVVITFS